MRDALERLKPRRPYLGPNPWLAVWDGRRGASLIAARAATTYPARVIGGLGKTALRGDGSSAFAGSSQGPLAGLDFSAEVPFTVYLVVTPRGSDITGQKVLFSASQDAVNRIYAQYLTGGELRIATQATSYSIADSSGLGLEVDTPYVIALEYSSTTALKAYVDGVEVVNATVTARDPGLLYGWWTHFIVSSGLYSEQDLCFYGVQSGSHSTATSAALYDAYIRSSLSLPDAANCLSLLDPFVYPADHGADFGGSITVDNYAFEWSGSEVLSHATSPPVADVSAEIPVTAYVAARPAAGDLSGSKAILSFYGSSANKFVFQYLATGELRIAGWESAVASVVDTSGLGLTAGELYVFAFEITSLTEYKIYVNGVEVASGTVTSRDPGDCATNAWGTQPGPASPWPSHSVYLGGIFSGTHNADVSAHFLAFAKARP